MGPCEIKYDQQILLLLSELDRHNSTLPRSDQREAMMLTDRHVMSSEIC
jgi:hypothetical protein